MAVLDQQIFNMDRDKQVAKIAKRLAEGGWSSIYQFVDDHVEDWELEDDDEEEEDDE